MSIGKRLIDLARSELNSLLERATPMGGEDDRDEDLYRRYSVDALSDLELEAELDRRRRAREAAAREAQHRAPGASARTAHATATATTEVRRAYAALEVPPGSDFATVRRAYRQLMRKYHPDRHTQSPAKQKTANELAQRLTGAYKLLEKHLRK